MIDERFDIDLLRAMADAHPEWQLVMVGPIVKIDQATLPRNPNIHYMGQASYDELPQYLAGWDVCLLPFALNESTRFISPTKVLEYMAAELPIVSTAITDVVKPYGEIVSVAYSQEEFIADCEAALVMTDAQRSSQIAAMREVAKATSWSSTATQMHALIEAPLQAKPGIATGVVAGAARVNPLRGNPVFIPGSKVADVVVAASASAGVAAGLSVAGE